MTGAYILCNEDFFCEQNNGWKDVYWINITSVTKNQLERFIHVSINFGSKIYSRKKKTNFERKHISLFVCIRFVSSLVHLFVKKSTQNLVFFCVCDLLSFLRKTVGTKNPTENKSTINFSQVKREYDNKIKTSKQKLHTAPHISHIITTTKN